MGDSSIKKAALINAGAKYSTTFLNLFFSAILARILTPEDYGIAAVAFVFISFFSIISDLGIGSAVIQNKNLSVRDTDSLFSFTVKLSILLAIGFALFSFPMAQFYHNKVYIHIGILLSISLIFSTCDIIPNALLLKEKKFVLVGIRSLAINILGSLIGIILALNGFKYYSLIIQFVIISFSTFLWNYISTKPKFKWKYNEGSLAKVKSFSTFQFGFNSINFFARNLDNLLISKIMGNASLAYYDKAYKLMLYPVQMLTHVITPVLHPILSDYQNDRLYIYKTYLKIVRILSLIGIFISTVCYLAADELIVIIFGDQWDSAVLPFRILSLSVWAQMVTASTGAIFQSLGKPKIMFYAGAFSALVTVSCIIIGLLFGDLYHLSIFVTLGFNVSFIINFWLLVVKGFNFKFYKFIRNFFSDIIIALIMLLTAFVFPFNHPNIYLSFLEKVTIISIVYGILLVLTKQHLFLFQFVTKRGRYEKNTEKN